MYEQFAERVVVILPVLIVFGLPFALLIWYIGADREY